MPGQDLDKQPNYTIKLLNMEPGIPQNRSLQNLVDAEETPDSTEVTHRRSIRDVPFRDWITVIILCFVNLINYMDRFTLAGILTEIQNHYHIDDSQGGLLQTAFILSYMIFAPIFGYLGDRYSRRLIMAFGVFLWSLTTFIGSYMNNFVLFVLFRTLVGIGEASYSTIAPTIISDLFVKDVRSIMLAFFYFAIPVGSGLGYIIGSETAKLFGIWQAGLRVTPILGAIAVLLIIFVLKDPERGQSEGAHLRTTSWFEDVKDILRNPSFMLSTFGFTCVAFIAGALAWWGPKFIFLGIKLQPGSEDVQLSDLSFPFGGITMLAGVFGLTIGCFLSQWLIKRYPRVDPLICGAGLLCSAPFLVGCALTAPKNTYVCFVLLFFGQVALNLNWAIVGDILLYVVVPTRRSTAEGFQLLVSHALGDAGSPYFIGMISDALRLLLTSNLNASSDIVTNGTSIAALRDVRSNEMDEINFKALQYALFTTCFVEVVGGVFFLITALYIVKDRLKVDRAVKGIADSDHSPRLVVVNETQRTLMS